MKFLCRHQLTVSIFNELCGCCLYEKPLYQFGERTLLCWQQPGLFGDFCGTPLDHNSIECNSVGYNSLSKKTFLNTTQLTQALRSMINNRELMIPQNFYMAKDTIIWKNHQLTEWGNNFLQTPHLIKLISNIYIKNSNN